MISLQTACDLTNKPKDSIEDIDGADVGNELAVTEYVDDIYKFYKLSEVNNLSLLIMMLFFYTSSTSYQKQIY